MDVKTQRIKPHEAYPYLREKSLQYWKRLQHTMDAHHTRVQMLEYRKMMLQKQQKMNYQNEYDRLRNALNATILRRHALTGGVVRGPVDGSSKTAVMKRLEELEKLGVNK
jgi:hypothetical protein